MYYTFFSSTIWFVFRRPLTSGVKTLRLRQSSSWSLYPGWVSHSRPPIACMHDVPRDFASNTPSQGSAGSARYKGQSVHNEVLYYWLGWISVESFQTLHIVTVSSFSGLLQHSWEKEWHHAYFITNSYSYIMPSFHRLGWNIWTSEITLTLHTALITL